MSNVISFQKALDDRKSYQENKEKIDSIIQERSKTYREFYYNMSHEEELQEYSPLLKMFFTTVYESYVDPRFEQGFLAIGGILEPDSNIIREQEIINCLRLYNSYNGKGFPKDSATILAFGSEEGIKTLMDLDVEPILDDADKYAIDDVKEVRQLFYEYLNEHPDVDTPRDALGELSVLVYQAIGYFIDRGYYFSRYVYKLVRQEEKYRSIPTPILIEFIKEDKEPIYIYYDYESAMLSFEAMLQDIFGDD